MAGVRLPPWLWSIVVAFAFVNAAFAAGMQTLGPVVADETVGRAAWGLVLAAQAAGMVLGGLLALRVRFRRPLLAGTLAVSWDVSMQSNIPEDRLSRVYAYDWFGSLVFIPVGQILAGPLSATTGVRDTIVGCGVAVAAAALGALAVPSVRRLRGEAAATAAAG